MQPQIGLLRHLHMIRVTRSWLLLGIQLGIMVAVVLLRSTFLDSLSLVDMALLLNTFTEHCILLNVEFDEETYNYLPHSERAVAIEMNVLFQVFAFFAL